jgi:hypothetical protein
MKRQFAEHLYEMKFIDSKDVKADSANRNSRNEALVRAVVCAGLYPNVAQVGFLFKGYIMKKNINGFQNQSLLNVS